MDVAQQAKLSKEHLSEKYPEILRSKAYVNEACIIIALLVS